MEKSYLKSENNFMIKNKLILILIFLLAVFLRLYQLGVNPPSLDWDEASLGYNAYSILKTGKDEFGRAWPISIRSFEDYKPAVYTYLTIPSIALLGLNEFSVRLPSAICGILTVIVAYFLIKELFGNKIAVLGTFLLAVSPWHVQFSRVAFEANVALLFVSAGILFYLKGINYGKWLIMSSICFVISFYTYHSPRLIVPFLLLGWSIYFRKKLMLQKKYVITGLIIGLVLLIPFIKEAFGEGKARLMSVTVITASDNLKDSISKIEYDQSHQDYLGALMHNRRIIYIFAVIKGYLDHFNLDFLFLSGDAPLRHHAVDMGMLYLWEAPFVLWGMLRLIKNKNFIIWWWFLIAPIASAVTTGTPHAVRALFYLPIYQIFTAIGLFEVMIRLKNYQIIRISLILLFSLNVFYYLNMYFINSPIEAAKDWQYGYKQAVETISLYDNAVDQVIMTYAYDQPHIYVMFYKKIDPYWYQQQYNGGEIKRAERDFGKYVFRNIDWEKDKLLKSVLLIGTASEIPAETPGIVREVKYPDGSVAFRIVKQ